MGARPQLIKACALNRFFKSSKDFKEDLIHTNQHYDKELSTIFFEELNLKPTIILKRPTQKLKRLHSIAFMFKELISILKQKKYDYVLVYGDTNSTLAAALAAKFLNIKLVHIEAGLRSFDFSMPEERNRIATDKMSTLLFAPTQAAMCNLKNENFEKSRYFLSHDIMIDNAIYFKDKTKKPLLLPKKPYAFVTIHRQNNTDNINFLLEILNALEEIANSFMSVFLPLHPRTKLALKKANYSFKTSKIIFNKPLSYLETLHALKHAHIVLTDSGGLQKEAYFFNKLCLVLRDTSEYVELIEKKYAKLVGHSKEKIIQSFANMQEDKRLIFEPYFYGNGKSAEKIANLLKEFACSLQ